MLGNLTALSYHYSSKPDDVFTLSLYVARSNATSSEIFTPESLGVDLPSLNETELCGVWFFLEAKGDVKSSGVFML